MIAMEGPLCKWTNVVKGWQYRYFTLDTDQALLSYYTSKEKMLKGDRRGCVRLKGAIIGIDEEFENTFTITVDQKIFHFQEQDPEQRRKWVSALEDTIFRHSHKRKYFKRLDPSKVPTVQDFENKLIESETYLKLLTDQIQDIDSKISASGKEKEETSLVDIKVKTLTLIDAIKQTMTLLQQSKTELNSVNGKKGIKTLKTSASASSELSQNDKPNVNGNSKCDSDERSTSNISGEVFCSDSIKCVTSSLNPVPETSYSSSEDEDDEYFFDAEEHSFGPEKRTSLAAQTTSNLAKMAIKDGDLVDDDLPEDCSQFDACYEEEDNEQDLDNLENQGSMISHILSQMKIGMDLTKVVLPTFILERRSLLEMYADFFAHPDLFIQIADLETPEQRFIQTVRWYLSAFHAGRKSSIAKKPYNPILGEVFKCYWEVPNYKSNQPSKNEKGPVPWSGTDNLSFFAEQVSHHPPVSAFYAEHPEKRIMCSAHIYTKSKFLGLSVGVHNIGQGSVYLLDHGEEYICTFPSAYGRSILTVPWMELGGSVSITCAQTGYSANIEFQTKPFYGGKKNKISGQINDPNNKSIMTLSGEWNGIMYSKVGNQPPQVFVNTKELSIIKKQVKPIREQKPYESRRLWKDVTMALKHQNVDDATNSKCAIEQRQRELVRMRADKGTKWENRAFHSFGEKWEYNFPLTTRNQKQSNP